MNARPLGRFAPSPTGQLHLGSLVTALASYCHIKSLGGDWLIRIEDVDFERCRPVYRQKIIDDLGTLGLFSDAPIVYQSERHTLYTEYLSKLSKHTYLCSCSRKDLGDTPIYPRHCLKHPPKDSAHTKLRLMMPDLNLAFMDGLQGLIWQNPQKTLGDVVIRRNNNMINYLFACAIDDATQGISHVLRGLDILPMTAAQQYIQKILKLPSPSHFYHLPLIMNQNGQKLSKQTLATPIDTTRPSALLLSAFALLGQELPKSLHNATPAQILAVATQHWQMTPLKKHTLAIV